MTYLKWWVVPIKTTTPFSKEAFPAAVNAHHFLSAGNNRPISFRVSMFWNTRSITVVNWTQKSLNIIPITAYWSLLGGLACCLIVKGKKAYRYVLRVHGRRQKVFDNSTGTSLIYISEIKSNTSTIKYWAPVLCRYTVLPWLMVLVCWLIISNWIRNGKPNKYKPNCQEDRFQTRTWIWVGLSCWIHYLDSSQRH